MSLTKEQREEAIKKFVKDNPAKKLDQAQGGGVAHGEIKEPVKQVAQVEAVDAGPSTFYALDSSMAGIDAHVIIMTMKQVVDYVTYASDLYDPSAIDEKGKVIDPLQSFQRNITPNRPKIIADYLRKELHFLPPIICIAAPDGVTVGDYDTVTVAARSLAALDGQHRYAGIASLLASADGGPDSDFAKESLPIVILPSDISIEDRQQIFADVNRNPKTVSKSLNILFDHRDPFAIISQAMVDSLGEMIDLTRTAPTAKSSNVASLSNLYNLAVNFGAQSPSKHGSGIREGLTSDNVLSTCLAVVEALPSFDRMKSGHDTYAACRASFICYSSTMFQAIGLALSHVLKKWSIESYANATAQLMAVTPWDIANPIWHHEQTPVVVAGKIGTRKENVSAAAAVLENLWFQANVTGVKEVGASA